MDSIAAFKRKRAALLNQFPPYSRSLFPCQQQHLILLLLEQNPQGLLQQNLKEINVMLIPAI